MSRGFPRIDDRASERVRVAKIDLALARKALRRSEKTQKRKTSRGLSKPLSDYKRDRDECDKLMSRLVRYKYGYCQACKREIRTSLQWAHGLSRRYLSVRYDWDNAFCLCSACHLRYTHDQISWTAFMNLTLGVESYDALQRRAQFKTRHDPRLVIGLRAEAERLGVLSDDGWRLWMEG